MRIKDIRVSRNLTQLELAKVLKVKRSTVSMWEQGKSEPRASMLKKIAEALNCTIDELIK